MGTIFLVRHAQASFGADDYDTLSELGREQARVTGQHLLLRCPKPHLLVTGSLKRHQETASLLGMGVEFDLDARWDEYDHQAMLKAFDHSLSSPSAIRQKLGADPEPHKTFQKWFKAAVVRWISGKFDADYPETWFDFSARVRNGLLACADQLADGGVAIVVTSGGPICAALGNTMELSSTKAAGLQERLVNASISRLNIQRSPKEPSSSLRVSVQSFGEHGHLYHPSSNLITYR